MYLYPNSPRYNSKISLEERKSIPENKLLPTTDSQNKFWRMEPNFRDQKFEIYGKCKCYSVEIKSEVNINRRRNESRILQ